MTGQVTNGAKGWIWMGLVLLWRGGKPVSEDGQRYEDLDRANKRVMGENSALVSWLCKVWPKRRDQGQRGT